MDYYTIKSFETRIGETEYAVVAQGRALQFFSDESHAKDFAYAMNWARKQQLQPYTWSGE